MMRISKIVLLMLPLLATVSATEAQTPIMGKMHASVEQMCNFVKSKNASFDCRIAKAYYKIGRKYGMRGDIAFCQAILETGWFKFGNGTAVTPKQHNYCGLGVESHGKKGCSFKTIELGVTAQMQHLYAYCCDKKLPKKEKLVDPRFNYVKRGIAPTWESLGGTWASSPNYGASILQLYNSMVKGH